MSWLENLKAKKSFETQGSNCHVIYLFIYFGFKEM